MKIGVCGGMDKAEIIKEAGYDYIEENLNVLAALSVEEFSSRVKFYEKLGLPVYSYNCFFAGGVNLHAPEALSFVSAYAEKALARAAVLGGEIVVLGSGGARNVPDGVSMEAGKARFARVLSVCGEAAEKHGFRLAVEPLSHSETNLIHTVAEGVEMAKQSGQASVGALVDFYHFTMNREKTDGLLCAADTLYHAHIARPNPDRRVPRKEDISTVKQWVEMLKQIRYKGNLSLECSYSEDFRGDLTATKEIVDLFREV